MTTIEQSIDVEVPVTVAYDQWTQFESFPSFMEGINEVRQLDDTHLHFKAQVAGATREWDAEITEQHPDERVAWKSTTGKQNSGVVTFHKLDPRHTRVMLQQEIETEGMVEKAADAFGIIERRAKGDLERFKEMIERRGVPSGGWRGDVPREN